MFGEHDHQKRRALEKRDRELRRIVGLGHPSNCDGHDELEAQGLQCF
jgi:hypothetical protein